MTDVEPLQVTGYSPQAQLDWLVEILQRDPLIFHEGELRAHFGPLGGYPTDVFDELLNRVTGTLSLQEIVDRQKRKIHAVLVDDESDFAAEVKIKVGPWWFPYVVTLDFQEQGGHWHVLWLIRGWWN